MKAIQRVIGTFSVMGVKRVPFAAVEVTKDETGKRAIPGVRPFIDTYPEIPLGRMTGSGDWVPYSRNEREAMAAEIKAKEDRSSKKEAKQDAYNALPIVERAAIEAKKADDKVKRAAKKAVVPGREPHTFVRVIRPLDRFIPPPTLDKPLSPPRIAVKDETITTLESEAERKARKERIEAYKHKQRPVWFTDSHAKHDKQAT